MLDIWRCEQRSGDRAGHVNFNIEHHHHITDTVTGDVIITGGVVGLGAGGHLAVGVLLRDGRQLLHLGHLLHTHSLRNVALGVRGVPEARVIIRVAWTEESSVVMDLNNHYNS